MILSVRHELLIFMGIAAAEPLTIPHSGHIAAYAISPCRRYLAVALETQIAVYEIKKGSNVVLLKNVNDLKVRKITKLGFYESPIPKIYFIDEIFRVGLVTIDIGIILTKVKIDELVHDLK